MILDEDFEYLDKKNSYKCLFAKKYVPIYFECLICLLSSINIMVKSVFAHSKHIYIMQRIHISKP